MNKWSIMACTWLSSIALAATYLLIGRGIDQIIGGTTVTVLPWAIATTIAAGLFAALASVIGGYLMPRLEIDARHAIVAHIFALGASERTKERAGRIVNTATDGVERSATYKSIFVGPMLASLATPALILIIIGALIDPVAAGIMAISVPLVPLCIGSFQAAFKPVSRRYRASSRALAAQELDAIQGLSALVLMNAGKRMGVTLAEAAENVRQKVMKYLAGNQLVLLVVDSVFSLGMITGAVVLALWRYDVGAITAGQGVAMVLLASIMLDPLDRVGQFFYIGMGGIAATKEIKRFTTQEPEVSDAPGVHVPTELPAPGTLTLDNVDFSYDGQTPVLANLSLSVAPGERAALVGPSGAGKSTVSALIQGARRPDAGRVLIDGVDLAEAPLAWVRSRIGVVEQTTHLFSGTLRDNLLIARPAATDDELIAALNAAHLTNLLERLPQGLDTQVGERAAALSGGEAQRVAIARAILKGAPYLLLDEPTAHVDLESEREILAALRDISANTTTLTISHRAATIDDADRRIDMAAINIPSSTNAAPIDEAVAEPVPTGAQR